MAGLLLFALLAGVAVGVLRLSGRWHARPAEMVIASGIIEARTIEVGTDVAGVVVSYPVEKGQTVTRGQTIAEIARPWPGQRCSAPAGRRAPLWLGLVGPRGLRSAAPRLRLGGAAPSFLLPPPSLLALPKNRTPRTTYEGDRPPGATVGYPLARPGTVAGQDGALALIMLFDASVIFLLASGWFPVPFRRSVVLLFAMALVFLLHSLGLGLVISALARNQQEAQLTAFMFSMPNVLLSGFTCPIENMPLPIQYLTYLVPFRYFLQIVRGVFLRGVGVGVLWPQMLVLAGFGVVTFVVGALAFRKRLLDEATA